MTEPLSTASRGTAPAPLSPWWILVVGLIASACARTEPPPGGPEDQRPPVVVRTVPAPFDTVVDLDEAIRFEFDERISERVGGSSLNDAITISPRGGDVEVEHGRRSLTLVVRGGLRAGVVYRVTLQPVVSDMFGNAMREPFELVFTTGPEPVPTTLAGQVWDRVTGRGVADAVVQAVGPDSLVHQAIADRGGIYAFRYLPAGSFAVQAFEDQNRDARLDSTEVQGITPATLAAGDTVLVDLAVLAPDTLPAILRGVEALDSVTLVLEFDDFLDPEAPLGAVTVQLERAEGPAPAVERVLHEAAYVDRVEEVADSLARVDSIARAAATPRPAEPAPADPSAPDPAAIPDTAAAPDTVAAPDSAAAAADTTGTGPTRDERGLSVLTPVAGTTPGLDERTGRVLPSSRLVALLASPVEPEIEYTVRASGVRNINGLEGGGGEAMMFVEPPMADTVPGDSAAVPDTSGVDTLSVPRR